MIEKAMDSVFNNNHLLAVFVIEHFVGDMKIFTYKFLPAIPNPFPL